MALACGRELWGRAEVRLGGDVVQDGRERRDISRRRLVSGGLFKGADAGNARWRWQARLDGLERRAKLRRVVDELLVAPLAVGVDILHLLFVYRHVPARASKEFVAVVGQDDELAVLAELPAAPLAGDAVGPVSPVGVVPSQRIVR